MYIRYCMYVRPECTRRQAARVGIGIGIYVSVAVGIGIYVSVTVGIQGGVCVRISVCVSNGIGVNFCSDFGVSIAMQACTDPPPFLCAQVMSHKTAWISFKIQIYL